MKHYLRIIALAYTLSVSGNPFFAKIYAAQTEDYEIYSALLEKVNKNMNNGKDVKMFVINDVTITPPGICSFDEMSKQEKSFQSIKLSFDDLSGAGKSTLSYSFKLSQTYTLLSYQDFRQIIKEGLPEEWSLFYEMYPAAAGFISLSKVGFNKDRTQAIVYMQTSCGFLCGAGEYILLTKSENKWKVSIIHGCWTT
jgi:hypothetical protein